MRNLIIVVILIVVAFFGWKLWSNSSTGNQTTNQGQNYSPAPTGSDTSSGDTGTNTQASSTTGLKLEGTEATSSSLLIVTPKANAKVTSPLIVSGKAVGNWYFEASAPIAVYDANGKLLGQSHITAQGDWMTTSFVNFTGSVTFTKPTTTTGYVVFTNDNPSGDPARTKYLVIPVSF